MQHLTRDELIGLLRAAKAHRERDWLMILVGFWHGLRASEVCGLTAGDIEDGFLTVKRLKKSLKTTQALIRHEDPLLNEADALPEYMRGMHRDQKLFPIGRIQFWRLVQRYAKVAGIPKHKAHTHVLKHSIAMTMIDVAGVEKVRQYLGHKSLASTGNYLRFTDLEASVAAQRVADGFGVKKDK